MALMLVKLNVRNAQTAQIHQLVQQLVVVLD